MNIQNNIASINAHADWMNANASNVANVNNKESGSLDTMITEKNQAVEAFIARDKEPVDITKEMTEQVPLMYGVKANVVSIQTRNETTKTMLNILV